MERAEELDQAGNGDALDYPAGYHELLQWWHCWICCAHRYREMVAISVHHAVALEGAAITELV